MTAVFSTVALVAAILAIGASPAQSAFPGSNGAIAFIRGGNVWTGQPGGVTAQQITAGGTLGNPEFNANSSQLVVEIFGTGLGTVAPTPGASVTQIPTTVVGDDHPTWFSNTRVLFENGGDIFGINTDGTDRVNLTAGTALSGGLANPDVSPDGSFFVADNDSAAPFGIVRFNLNAGATAVASSAIQLTPAGDCPAAGDCNQPDVSPNPHNVIFDGSAAAPGGTGIYRVNTAGTSAASTQLTAGGHTDPEYSPDGARMTFEVGGGVATAPSDGSVAPTTQSWSAAGDTDPVWGSTGTTTTPPDDPEGAPGDPECSDGLDNDGDGLIDGNDPDCQPTTPADGTISGTATSSAGAGFGGGGFFDIFFGGGVFPGTTDSRQFGGGGFFDLFFGGGTSGGGPLAGVEVTAENEDTGDEFTDTTDSDGDYSLDAPAGDYEVSATFTPTSTSQFGFGGFGFGGGTTGPVACTSNGSTTVDVSLSAGETEDVDWTCNTGGGGFFGGFNLGALLGGFGAFG